MPVLSICIPTLNRADYLDECLNSIVNQDIFRSTSLVEVVVSDNASTDNTKEIVEKYIKQFATKIHYFRADKRLPAMDNFYNVLTGANGDFLKLCNDTCEFYGNDLKKMVDFINQHKDKKPILFFIGQVIKQDICCKNLDDFITHISFFNTWSPPFGLWKEDRHWIELFKEKSKTHIAQTYILCKMISEGRQLCANSHICFKIKSPSKKGGYNIAEVFGYNYLNILKEFLQTGHLSKNIYEKEKRKLLLTHINPFYFDIHKQFAFDKNGYFKWLWNDYKHYPYFYFGYIKMYLKFLFSFIFSIHKTVDRKYKYKTIILFGIKIKIKKKIK